MEHAGDVGEKRAPPPPLQSHCHVWSFLCPFLDNATPPEKRQRLHGCLNLFGTHTLRPTHPGFARLSSSSPSHASASPPPKLTTLTTNNDIHRNRFPCWVQLVIFYDSYFLIYSFPPFSLLFRGFTSRSWFFKFQ